MNWVIDELVITDITLLDSISRLSGRDIGSAIKRRPFRTKR
ncbi:hypothetical protein [Xenorhabdus santafensis]|nr:hypothetical protein [Xenorhabdus sp. 12]